MKKMDAKRIPFEQLPITNRFMFAMVFGHKEIAKPFLEAVLGIRIHELKDPEPELSRSCRRQRRQMQMEDNENIPKRTRYYQAMCDSEALNKGEVYYKLNDLYIMFPHRG